jgi:predicted enzyme related to lactoylglutathione lyase
MVLQAAGGDPPDEPAQFNEWLWPELWTDQPAAAIEFYEAVLGYRSVAVREKDGSELTVLGRDGMARATLVKSPWPEVKPNWLLYLAVEDIGETVQNIERNGGEVLVPATLSSDGDVAIVADPTGGVFALQERRQR